MPTKTREKLIDVARQLFIHKGVENTTMNDIASASDKGRRTIYTYFKNKREIYNAVIDAESDKTVGQMRQIVNSHAGGAERLRAFFAMRFAPDRAATTPYSTIRSLISREYRRTAHIRRRAYEKEEEILREILRDGVESGEFDPQRCRLLTGFLHRLLQCIDLSVMSEQTPASSSQTFSNIVFGTPSAPNASENAASPYPFAESLTEFIISDIVRDNGRKS